MGELLLREASETQGQLHLCMVLVDYLSSISSWEEMRGGDGRRGEWGREREMREKRREERERE